MTNTRDTSDANRPRILKDEELFIQLGHAIDLRSSEDQTLWATFGAFWATHAILLVALFTTGHFPEDSKVGLVVSGVGAVVSLMWHGIQRRSIGHVSRHEALMKTLEMQLKLPADFAVSAEINRKAYKQTMPKGPRARSLMTICSLGATVLWIAVFAMFLFASASTPANKALQHRDESKQSCAPLAAERRTLRVKI